MDSICYGCGARLPAGAAQCDLCGLPVGTDGPARVETVVSEPAPSAPPEETPTPEAASSVFCNQCGWENPTGSRFCAQCGASLQVVAATRRAAPEPAPAVQPPVGGIGAPEAAGPQSVGRRLALIFGAALILIVAFFLIDAARNGDEAPGTPAAEGQPTTAMPTVDTPLAADVAATVDALRAEAEGLSGEARVAKLRLIVDALVAAGRFDKAGPEQEAIAVLTGTASDWQRAGNLYYDWMDVHDGPERVRFAKSAIAAYRKVLELEPDNLDVRTDLAVAYMSDPDNPMLAIQENAAVLAVDSLHVQANFNRGIMLLQINRIDGAIAQFEKVQRIVGDPQDPMYVLAEQALLQVRQQGMPAN